MLRHRSLIGLGLAAVLSAVLTLLRVPLASSQGVTLVAAQVQGNLPVDNPDDALWSKATAIEVPLSAQNVTRPMLPTARIRSVTARAIFNDTQVAVLVQWADDTKDDGTVRVQAFRDAVAVEFPLADAQPYFCMGQQGGNVNIWQWKADWQADITARQDMRTLYPNMFVSQYPFTAVTGGAADTLATGPGDYTDQNYLPALAAGNLLASPTRNSPVENLIAGGFGTLTTQPPNLQNVNGSGVWANKQWRAIFSRALSTQNADDVQFGQGKVYSMAFAAWDGSNGERNGQKSTSQWVSFQLKAPASPAQPQQPATPFDMLGMVLVFGPMCLVALAGLALAGAAVTLGALARRS